MAIPNFRKIYSAFRSPEEEKSLSNQAVYKFAGFVLVVLLMSIAKRNAFPGPAEAVEAVQGVAVGVAERMADKVADGFG